MSVKVLLYLMMTPIVLYSLDSVNINQIFKKNKVMKARVFYLILALCMIYLLTNFVYDFFYLNKNNLNV